uniref:CCHC-type domain-containing protein n=1 Tax=Odontella aurita TaxID=265563 RepID=A0A7S4J911_9STRA|mmetsp:Transcript_41539/g.125888  ORF Transcript_41539/g.125888 Transcript_41539/m.125888 type:complete len:558 (+) Transcript_41539:88-1761(+)
MASHCAGSGAPSTGGDGEPPRRTTDRPAADAPAVPNPLWRVWRAASALDAAGGDAGSSSNTFSSSSSSSSSLLADPASRRRYGPLAAEAAAVLRDWGRRWGGGDGADDGGEDDWGGLQSFLNKQTLLHEIEESLVVIEALIEWLKETKGAGDDGGGRDQRDEDVTVVDLCCGKGVLSVLLSHLAARGSLALPSSSKEESCCAPLRYVRRCVMADKIVEGRGNRGGADDGVDWSHVRRTNLDIDRASARCNGEECEASATVPIEVWGGANLHSDDFYDRMRSLVTTKDGVDDGVLAVVGIHLCGMLSPRAMGLFNTLGPDRAPFLCLAPCCLPRQARKKRGKRKRSRTGDAKGKEKESLDAGGGVANKASGGGGHPSADIVSVDLFETDEMRSARAEAVRLRNRALRRNNGGGSLRCYVCSEEGHRARDCPTLPPDDKGERVRLLREAAAKLPCWRCGKIGHQKADCPSGQESSRPELPLPARIEVDVSGVREEEEPFGAYCQLLAETAQCGMCGRSEVRATCLEGPHKNLVGNGGNGAIASANWNAARKANYIVVCR